jgi:hypothetical protein
MEQQVEKEKNYNRDMQKLYNIIIKVDSMDQLTKEGWKIINKIKENRVDIDKKVSIISVLGNKNAGKSFILHLLTGKNIPNGYTVTTEGLSFIMPEEGDNRGDNYILIDTAGTESPLLLEKITKMTIDSINKMAKDRLITDYFLQKFILEKSDIFICVVDNLSLTGQKFINRIVKSYTNKTIFIIHNLKTFIEKEQVENYIENTLMKSLTFELSKEDIIELDDNEFKELEDKNRIYFKQELKEDERIIIHLILACENTKAGDYYNISTIKFLKKQLFQVKEKRKFDVVQNLKEFLLSISPEIFNTRLDENLIKEENNAIKIDAEALDLKDCFIDYLGNNVIKENKFKPKYRCGYFTDSSDKKKFFLEIELFEEWTFIQKIDVLERYFILTMKGEKNSKLKEKEYLFNNYSPGNDFQIEIKVENNRGIIKDMKPNLVEENGLYIFIYELREKHTEEEIISEDSEEEDEKP